MARDRQRAKQRQAERRAARLSRSGDGRGGRDGRADPPKDAASPGAAPPVEIGGDAAEAAALAASAPPEDTGRSDAVLEGSALPEEELEEAEPLAEEELDEAEEELAIAEGTTRRKPKQDQEARRGKVREFLVNVWAELQRVQWPDRSSVTSLTAVVLVFVLITGGYLGLLDALFSRVIDSIL